MHTEESTELVLSPRRLSSLVRDSCGNPPSSSSSTSDSSLRTSSNFVVITIMEPPRAPEVLHPRSLGLDPHRWTLWSRGSPVLLVSLVPAGHAADQAAGAAGEPGSCQPRHRHSLRLLPVRLPRAAGPCAAVLDPNGPAGFRGGSKRWMNVSGARTRLQQRNLVL